MNQPNTHVAEKGQQDNTLVEKNQDPLEKKTTKKGFANKKEYFRILKYMQKHYPKAFTDPPSPLAIGIHVEIRKNEEGRISNNLINKFLFAYTRSKKYKSSFLVGTNRLDLQGNSVSIICQGDLEHHK